MIDAERAEWMIRGINTYFTAFIIFFGLFGNTLSLIIMSQKKNRKISACLYMVILAVSDNLQMIVLLIEWIHTVMLAKPMTSPYCKAYIYLAAIFGETSIYLVVIMTIDRFVAVKYPLKKQWRTPKRVGIHTGVLIIVMLLRNVHVILHSNAVYDEGLGAKACLIYYDGTVESKSLSVWDQLMQAIIPFCILISCNGYIIYKIRRRKLQVNNLNSSQDENEVFKRRQLSITIMLFFISFSVIILILPLNITLLAMDVIKVEKDDNTLFVLIELFVKFFFLNSALNFYVCLLGGSRFRKDLVQLFCSRSKCVQTEQEEDS